MEQLEQFVEAFADGRLVEAELILKDILTVEANKLLEATESDDDGEMDDDVESDEEEEVEEKGSDESEKEEK